MPPNSNVTRLLCHLPTDGSWPELPACDRTWEPTYAAEPARTTVSSGHHRRGSTRCCHPATGLKATIPVAVSGKSCGVKREGHRRLALYE